MGEGARGRPVKPPIVGTIAGGARGRVFGERLARNYTWIGHDCLEALPRVASGLGVAAVVVDLLRWNPLEAAPVLKELRQGWPALRIVCLYEPTPDLLPRLADLAASDPRLAFVCDAANRLDLLVGPISEAGAFKPPTASHVLLQHLLPLATDPALKNTLIHLALAPSARRSMPALAALLNLSEDALERRCGKAGLAPPALLRRLAVAAEGFWQSAALRLPASQVAGSLGLGTADSLGRVLKRVFGCGFKATRLMGTEGAARALRWIGLLALRDLQLGSLTSLASIRLVVPSTVHAERCGDLLIVDSIDRRSQVRLAGAARELWELAIQGVSLEAIVEQTCVPAAPGASYAYDVVPTLRSLLQLGLLRPTGPLGRP